METSLTLTILYTAHLKGQLELLPRLHSFIRFLKSQQPGRNLLLDLGDSCIPEVWHCTVTGGRSTLVVMDSMGYNAANVAGVLTASARAKLETTLSLALVDETHPYTYPYPVQIQLNPAPETKVENGVLWLADVGVGQVGEVRIEEQTIIHEQVHALPKVATTSTLPDSTIAAMVDLVIGEARHQESKFRH